MKDVNARRELSSRIASRTRSLILRARISDNTELDALEDYWSIGNMNSDILPILNSVVTTAGIEKLDLVHLLPPVPRQLLYTYPRPHQLLDAEARDCFWTCSNFFNHWPSDNFEAKTAYLRESFATVDPPFRYGDVLLLADNPSELGGKALHACVFIADNIVYTKNGLGLSQPWTLMKFNDMAARYPEATTVQAYRAQ